jgi:hypothetical protein
VLQYTHNRQAGRQAPNLTAPWAATTGVATQHNVPSFIGDIGLAADTKAQPCRHTSSPVSIVNSSPILFFFYLFFCTLSVHKFVLILYTKRFIDDPRVGRRKDYYHGRSRIHEEVL